jgi:hypothetical protein
MYTAIVLRLDAQDYKCSSARYRFHGEGIMTSCLKVSPDEWVNAMTSMRSPRGTIDPSKFFLTPDSPEVLAEQARLISLAINSKQRRGNVLKRAGNLAWMTQHKAIRSACKLAGHGDAVPTIQPPLVPPVDLNELRTPIASWVPFYCVREADFVKANLYMPMGPLKDSIIIHTNILEYTIIVYVLI